MHEMLQASNLQSYSLPADRCQCEPFRMIGIKVTFSEPNMVLLAALRGLAAKAAGFDAASGTQDATLTKKHFVHFYFKTERQVLLFREYVGEYIAEKHVRTLTIQHDNNAPEIVKDRILAG